MKPAEAKILELDSYRAKKANKCFFCNCRDDLYIFKKQTVCLDCLRNIRTLCQNSHSRFTIL